MRDLNRRGVIGLLSGAAAWPLGARAQSGGDSLRVGFLGAGSATGYAARVDALRAGLHELGYVEGRNLIFEARWADGIYERLVPLATELVRLGSHIIVTHGTPGTRAASQVTSTVPIVMAVTGDAVGTKLVDSLARPGANVTGSSFFSPELNVKQLDLLLEAGPHLKRLAFVVNPSNIFTETTMPSFENAARAAGVQVQRVDVRTPAELSQAFSMMKEERVEAAVIENDGMVTSNAANIAAIASRHGLPTAGEAELAKAGGAIGYGPSFVELFRRAAYFIDRIAKSAKPSDLPVEQPTKFELNINLKTTKALGFEVPPTLLARADEVIE